MMLRILNNLYKNDDKYDDKNIKYSTKLDFEKNKGLDSSGL